jgi:[acyl-carrier-protein] S-malonyltransferase
MEKIAFLFPGQGAQFVGMGKSVHDQYDLARHTFEEAGDVLGFDLAKLCFEGSLSDLNRANKGWPALLTVSVALFRVYMKELGVAPQFCAGHSLGEYAALTCSGGLKFPDALKIVRFRGELSEELVSRGAGAMTVIEGVDRSVVEAECRKLSGDGKLVAISCYNAPHQTDISGHQDLVMEVEGRILELGGQITPLMGSSPMHSPLMQEAALKLKDELQGYSYGYLRTPVVANVTARLYRGAESITENLVAHLVRPVQWQATIEYLQRNGVTLVVEMGPKNVLSSLTKLNAPDIRALCFGVREDRQALNDMLSVPLFKKHVPTVVTKCLAIGASTPNKNWDNDAYRAGVIQPYRRIQEIQAQLDQEGRAPTRDEMRVALESLRAILETKQVPVKEQIDWFDQLFDETGTRYEFSEFAELAKR